MKKNLLAGIFFLTISVLVVSIWFRDGLLYGGGDVGLPEYNPARILERIKYVWWDVSGTGFLRSSGVTGIPLYTTLFSLDKLGFSYVSIQTLVFAISLFLAGSGMYLVAKSYFGEKGSLLAIVAGLFYIFNAFSMVQIWHRFVRPGFYFIAVLPLFFLLWRLWIKNGKYTILIIFLLLNFFFAFIFSTLGYIIALWILLGLYVVGQIILPWKGTKAFWRLTSRFVQGLGFWLATSFWWIYPLATTAPALLARQHSVYESVINAQSLARQSIVPYSIAGLNPFYLFEEADFGPIFSTTQFVVIPYLIAATVFLGLFESLKKRKFLFLGLFFVLSLFLAKGVSSPFGHLLTVLFEKSFILGVVRNPFEKLGLLMAFSSSVLFPLGIRKVLAIANRKATKLISVIFVLIVVAGFAAYSWPIWSGKVFGKADNPAYIEVPQSYKDADRWIAERGKEGRLLHLPLTQGDGISYKWQYGYNGLEPSELLFTYPSIAHGLGLDTLDDIIKSLILTFRQLDEVDDTTLKRFLNALNVSYVVLHKDVDWVPGGWDSPQRLEELLAKKPIFKKLNEFGDLVIYEVNFDKREQIILASSLQYIDIGEHNLFWPWMVSDKGSLFFSPIVQEDNAFVAEKASEFLLTPQTVIITPNRQLAFKETARAELPYVRFLPNSPLYSLIRIKEQFELVKQPIQGRFWTILTFSGKRLIEMDILAKKESISSTLVTRYEKAVNEALDELIRRGLKTIQPKEELIIKNNFANQILIINELIESLPKDFHERAVLLDLLTNLRIRLADLGLIPFYQAESFGKHVNRFSAPISGEYEILLAEQGSSGLYDGLENLNFLVDDKPVKLAGKREGNFLNFGKVMFAEGIHEISYEKKVSEALGRTEALFQEGGVYQLDSKEHESVSISWQIPDFRPDSLYAVFFEYWVRKGAGPILQVVHDTDPEDRKKPSEKVRILNQAFEPNDYNFYWYEARETFTPRVNASSLDIKFIVEPWNNCKKVLLERCEDEEVARGFDRPSSVLIRNVKITRELVNPILLRGSKQTDGQSTSAVEFKKLSPIRYVGNVTTETSSFMVFAETFHPDWVLTLVNGKGERKIVESKFLADLYANAWYIETPGEYQFELEFVPQKRVGRGLVVSLTGGLLVALLVLKERRKK